MRLNGFRCDVCCKEHLLEPTVTFHSVTGVLPDDWFMLWRGKYGDAKEPVLFCSVACIVQWAEKQAFQNFVAGEVEPARGGLVTKEAPPSSTEIFQGLAERLQQLGEVPRKRLMQGNWLPGDEE